MSKYITRIRNLIPGLRRPDNNDPPQGVTVHMGEVDAKEKDLRKMSFYNPLNPVPKYDFHAKNTSAGRLKRTRLPLDVLHQPPDPDAFPPSLEEVGWPKVKLVRFGWVLGVMLFSLAGWRPPYHYYSPWTSLFGAFSSFLLMFLFTWWAALVTFCVILFLLGYVAYKKPKINWGTSYQAGFYNMALSFSMSLTGVEDHVKNFRPQCLVLTGPPNVRPALVDFVGTFTKNIRLMICGNIIMEDEKSSFPQHSTDMLVDWLNQRKVRSFYTSFTADSLKEGTHSLMQASGLGKLKPNTLVLGYKMNWQECKPKSLQDYVNTISDAFDSSYGIAILRMMDGLHVTADLHSAGRSSATDNPAFDADEVPQCESDRNSDISDDGSNEQVRSVFQTKTIDIYWISDDGGLTLLVPYLLTRRNRRKKSKLRVFILGGRETMEEDRKDMKMLLKRFRLEIEDIVVITDVDKAPLAKNLQRYEETIAPFRLTEEQAGGDVQELKRPWKVSDKDLEAIKPKVERTMRLNEIIKKNSIHAALIVISLPVPDITCPSSLYVAWLDSLSFGIHCPMLFKPRERHDLLLPVNVTVHH